MENIKIILFIFLLSISVFGQSSITPYYDLTRSLPAPPGALDTAYGGIINPALLTYVRNFNSLFTFSNPPGDFLTFTEAGFFTALPNAGNGILAYRQVDDTWLFKIRIANGWGNKYFSLGLGYEWNTANASLFAATNTLTLGVLIRPSSYLSLGLSGNATFDLQEQELTGELSLRPLGNDYITLFADYALPNPRAWGDFLNGDYSTGAVLKLPLVKGIYFTGRYYPKQMNFSVGMKVGSGAAGITAQSHIPTDLSLVQNTYGITVDTGAESYLEDMVERGNYYLVLNLNGIIDYRQSALGSLPGVKRRYTLLSLLDTIRKAKEDITVAGIIVNILGLTTNREILWEIRQSLADFKASGKHVIVYLEEAEFDLYHFAAVADKILLDPLGTIILQGYAAGSSFYKNLLAKAGIGFEEFRLYSHKSAGENFSRTEMSEENREQYSALLRDFYTTAGKDICAGRNFTETKFDALVNREFLFTADKALEQHLVDKIGRWDAVYALISELEGSSKFLIGEAQLKANKRSYAEKWGELPHIAVIYALGVCDMETGINARHLQTVIRNAGNNPFIKAVVIRVDSPGGSALASDLAAEAIKQCQEQKPVVISQGLVAASGGYWLSMYGDLIVASPYTITGSIGVAGSWLYNAGLKENLGITTDLVKEGSHADYKLPFTLPLLGLGLIDRNLMPEEQEKIKENMRFIYKEFIAKVAAGRYTTPEEIEKVAQGRIWSGLKAKELGLVDEIGNLRDAIEFARERAGIPEKQELKLVELPEYNIFDQLSPYLSLVGLTPGANKTAWLNPGINPYFDFLLKHNGETLALLRLDELELITAE